MLAAAAGSVVKQLHRPLDLAIVYSNLEPMRLYGVLYIDWAEIAVRWRYERHDRCAQFQLTNLSVMYAASLVVADVLCCCLMPSACGTF